MSIIHSMNKWTEDSLPLFAILQGTKLLNAGYMVKKMIEQQKDSFFWWLAKQQNEVYKMYAD